MNVNKALVTRIYEICKEKDMTITALCLNSNLTPSTVFEIIQGKTKHPTVLTVLKLCNGAGITINEFFNREYFSDVSEIFS